MRISNTAENGSKSKTPRTGWRGAASLPVMVVAVSLGLAGCSWTFPGLKSESVSQKVIDDDITTGSIKPAASPRNTINQLKNLDEEDWRRASAALAVAVDPHGSTDRVLWDNPKTQAKGSFVPDGPPFVRNDEVCRNFKAQVSEPNEAHSLVGTACRPSGGDWDISEIKPALQPKAGDSKPARKVDVKKLEPAKAGPKQVAKATP